jgi:hypothetical protein
MAISSVKQALLEGISHLPDDRLPEVLLFVNFLLYSQQRAASAQLPEDISEPSASDAVQDPLAAFIGAVAHGSVTHSLDEAIYGS